MNYPIICFEGPSGIGKSTMSQLLSDDFNIVPEVNLLFERPDSVSEYWYHEMQVERYKMCQRSSQMSILDGDIFQPIWYNWACKYPSNFLSKAKTHRFYKSKLETGKMRFPDLYIIFHVEERELWVRKENDKTRQRRNFEKHLKIIEPLKEYWKFLNEETEVEVKFVHYKDLESTKREVMSFIRDVEVLSIDHLNAFKQIENWIHSRGENV